MSLCQTLENYVNNLVKCEVELTAIDTELFFNPRLQLPKNQNQVAAMKAKSGQLFEESQYIRRTLFGNDLGSKEVLELIEKDKQPYL